MVAAEVTWPQATQEEQAVAEAVMPCSKVPHHFLPLPSTLQLARRVPLESPVEALAEPGVHHPLAHTRRLPVAVAETSRPLEHPLSPDVVVMVALVHPAPTGGTVAQVSLGSLFLQHCG